MRTISTTLRLLDPLRASARTWLRAAGTVALAASLAACAGKTLRPATDDSGISTRVRTALLNDPQVAAGGISVSAANGVVTLSGSVRTPAERDRAVALARQTSGVSDVRSELAVTQP
jgi:hyperosmotically inducible protein